MKDYKEFFASVDKMYFDMEAFRRKAKDGFWSTRIDHEADPKDCKPFKENKLLHFGHLMVNGDQRHDCVFFWRTTPSYMKRMDPEKMVKESEVKKIVLSKNGYDYCLVRDHLRPPTNTYYGYKFVLEMPNRHYDHEFALFKDNELVYKHHERWMFELFCNGFEPKGLGPMRTAYDAFRNINPIKVFVKDFDKERISCDILSEKFDYIVNTPSNVYGDFERMKYVPANRKNMWCVFITNENRKSTWWIMESITRPTVNEALEHFFKTYLHYCEDCGNSYPKFLMKIRDSIDLNKINILAEERMQELYYRKIASSLQKMLNEKTLKKLIENWKKIQS